MVFLNIIIFSLSAQRLINRISLVAATVPKSPANSSLDSLVPVPRLFLSTSQQHHTPELSLPNQTDLFSESKNLARNLNSSTSKRNFQKRELSLRSSDPTGIKASKSQTNEQMKQKMMFEYPKPKRDESQVENIFGFEVKDPYRAFEDPEAEATKEFVNAQNKVTEPYLDQCPHRAKIEKILTANQDYERIGCPFKRGNKYYHFKNSGLQPQAVLYQQDTIDSEPRVFFDPNLLSEDGTVSMTHAAFSPNGEYFAYGLSSGGSDWTEIGIKNVSSGKDFDEKLQRAKFTSIEWTHDNNGFFYAQYPTSKGETKGTNAEKNENHSVFYHTLNTPQSEDVLKVNFPSNPNWNVGFEVSHDGRYLHVFPREGCQDVLWYYCDLTSFGPKDKLTLSPIFEKFEAEFDYITNNGKTVYFKTNHGALNYRVAKLDLSNPAKENWVDVISNHPENVLDHIEAFSHEGQDYLLINYMRKVVYYLELHKLDGGLVKKFPMPPGTISKTSGRRGDGEIFFHFSSFLSPGQTYHFNLSNIDSEAQLIRQAKPKGFSADDYTIEQVFYKSKDSTEIPMFIVHRKDLVKDGKNPCLLYGYGGFNIQVTSSFSVNRIAWLKNFKGIFAVANIRGGGELGKSWHDSGKVLNKQNCFHDFIAAAEYLIDNKFTNRDKIAIEGGSNGGLLVAASSNLRPDLFGASICHVGVLDMLRYHLFTIGHAWIPDFGDPNIKEHFEYLLKYSPYHNIPVDATRYPATLLLTADHDDRVVPAHSYKYIANLQYHLGSKLPDTPLLIRVDTKAGHGAGQPTSKVIKKYCDIYSFLYNALDLGQYYKDE